MTNGSLMKIESIAEPFGAFCNTSNLHKVIIIFFGLFESGRFTKKGVSMRAKQVVRLNNNKFEQNKLAPSQHKLCSFYVEGSAVAQWLSA